MKIYTKTGDGGETGLFGGQRVLKSELRVDTYGTVDELNALLGLVISECTWEELIDMLESIQSDLFQMGADLATPHQSKHEDKIQRLTNTPILRLESWIDELDGQLPELRSFILPGGSQTGATLHLARTVCRRAERKITALSQLEEVNSIVLIYLNRLSDLLFVMARYANSLDGYPDVIWNPNDDR